MELVLIFMDDAGNWKGWTGTGAVGVNTGGQTTLNWSLIGSPCAYQAPTGSTKARIELRKHDTFTGQADSWAWFWRPYAGEARAGQTLPLIHISTSCPALPQR